MVEENTIGRVRQPRGVEVLGIVESKLGSSKLMVRCQDGKMRICRIPGRLRKRMWVNVDDIVIIEPWEIQTHERGDLIWRYSEAQASWLRKRGLLKM